jgi:hypothetical protein
MSFYRILGILVAVMSSVALMAFALTGFSEGLDSSEGGFSADGYLPKDLPADMNFLLALVLVGLSIPFFFLYLGE